MTHDEYVAFCEAVGASPHTTRLDRTAARSVTAGAGVPVETAEPADLDRWWVWCGRRRLTPATRSYYLRALRRYYRWRHERTGQADPSAQLHALKVPGRLPRPVPIAAALHTLAAAGGDTQVMIGLALFAGLRVHEIAALTPDQVRDDGAGGRYLYIVGKGGRERRVPMVADLEQLLARYQWPDVTPAAVTMRVRHALTRHTGRRYTAHQLRHTFATEVLAGGANLIALQRLLGHVSVQTTQVYADVTVDTLTDAVRAAFPAA